MIRLRFLVKKLFTDIIKKKGAQFICLITIYFTPYSESKTIHTSKTKMILYDNKFRPTRLKFQRRIVLYDYYVE